MSVLTQSYQCGTWFVCSILRELAVSNLGQPLFCLSITWSRCRNAYRDLWIMTIVMTFLDLAVQMTHYFCKQLGFFLIVCKRFYLEAHPFQLAGPNVANTLVICSHSHSAQFDVVTPPLSCPFSYLYIGRSYPTPNAQCWSLNVTFRSIQIFSIK